MFAHVLPLLRLPASLTHFDYAIPAELTISEGDLVEISFRGRNALGVVVHTSVTSSLKRISPVRACVIPHFLSPQDIARTYFIARLLGQSPATILHASIPAGVHYGRRDVASASKQCTDATSLQPHPETITAVRSLLAHIHAQESDAIIPLQGDEDMGVLLAVALAKNISPAQQMLLLAPRDRDAELVAQKLRFAHAELLTGKTPPKKRAELFSAWRTGKLPLLVGTKQAALWFPKNLSTVLVLSAGNDEYENLRRNPRIDPREYAKLLARDAHARYISIDTLPRIDDCAEGSLGPYAPLQEPQWISLKNAEEKTKDPLLTQTLLEEVANTVQNHKKVLLFLNRKGVAKRLQCGACGHIPLCGTCHSVPTVRAGDLVCATCATEMWIPQTCPACSSTRIKLRGVGGEKVVAQLREHYPDLSIGVVEKGNDSAWKTAQIVVATEHVFANLISPFVRYDIGLVADVLADIATGDVDYRANEHASRHLLRLLFLAERERARCIFQTWLPERLPDLVVPEFLIHEELRIRRDYHLPPFGVIITEGDVQKRFTLPDFAQTLKDTPPIEKEAAHHSFTVTAPYVAFARPPRT